MGNRRYQAPAPADLHDLARRAARVYVLADVGGYIVITPNADPHRPWRARHIVWRWHPATAAGHWHEVDCLDGRARDLVETARAFGGRRLDY